MQPTLYFHSVVVIRTIGYAVDGAVATALKMKREKKDLKTKTKNRKNMIKSDERRGKRAQWLNENNKMHLMLWGTHVRTRDCINLCPKTISKKHFRFLLFAFVFCASESTFSFLCLPLAASHSCRFYFQGPRQQWERSFDRPENQKCIFVFVFLSLSFENHNSFEWNRKWPWTGRMSENWMKNNWKNRFVVKENELRSFLSVDWILSMNIFDDEPINAQFIVYNPIIKCFIELNRKNDYIFFVADMNRRLIERFIILEHYKTAASDS